MNIGSKRHIAWNTSRHAPLGRFFSHCEMEETGSHNIIYIISHHVLRHPSEHGTSVIGKHLLMKAHIAKWNTLTDFEVTEFTSSTVGKTGLTIVRRQRSWGIAILSLQMRFKFDIWIVSIFTKLRDKTLLTVSEGLFNCQIAPRHLQLLPHVMICFCSYTIECYPNLELWWTFDALRNKSVLPSAGTRSNICARECVLTLDSIRKQLPSRNEVSLALEGWTSTNKLVIMSVITYTEDYNWAMYEVQLDFDEVDNLFYCYSETKSRMIGLESPCGRTASCTFEVGSWSFWTYWCTVTCNYNWYWFLRWLNHMQSTINLWVLQNQVACIEKPHTMHGTCHSASFRCIQKLSGCKRPNKVLAIP